MDLKEQDARSKEIRDQDAVYHSILAREFVAGKQINIAPGALFEWNVLTGRGRECSGDMKYARQKAEAYRCLVLVCEWSRLHRERADTAGVEAELQSSWRGTMPGLIDRVIEAGLSMPPSNIDEAEKTYKLIHAEILPWFSRLPRFPGERWMTAQELAEKYHKSEAAVRTCLSRLYEANNSIRRGEQKPFYYNESTVKIAIQAIGAK